MYGMVNRALEDMVRSTHGDEAWEKIRCQAEVEDEIFISDQGYPDEVTFRLVAAAESILGIPQAQLLEAFGRHWILVTGRQGYGHLISAGGGTLREFLVNLPNFHTRISLMFPQLRPPQFCCSASTDRSATLHYESEREGLSPFVTGLILGLGEMFGEAVNVNAEARTDDPKRSMFHIRW